MTEIIPALSALQGRYDALFCDLWGVLHNGVKAHEAAVAALTAFREAGGRVVLVTNAPRPFTSVEAQIHRLGAPRDCYDFIVTSGDATQKEILEGGWGNRCFHIGATKDEPFFETMPLERVPLDSADYVLCTGLTDDRTETPADYADVLRAAKERGLRFLCANPDIIVDHGEHRLYCAGAIAAAYEEIGGETAYCGKPHAPIYDYAIAKLGETAPVAKDRILMIGDGVATDIEGARRNALDALFIGAGIAAGDVLKNGEIDAAATEAFVKAHNQAPEWAMTRLR